LAKFTGLWHGVAVADFDGDGKPDIAASNAGRNTAYELYPLTVRLFYGDANGDGMMELAEAFADTKTKQWKPIRTLKVYAETFPHIQGTITRNKTFAGASLPQIIVPAFGGMKSLEITGLSSAVFLNKTGHFEMRPLPDASQLAPAFDLCAEDLDDDGAVDLFLAQNAFGVSERTSRYDSGRGLLLRGDGTGNFAAVPASGSGIALYGEQRGVTAADFNNDGRADLVVGQRGAATRLFINRKTD